MHAQELAHIIATKGDEVRDLLALRLTDAQPLTGLDLEADVSTRNHRDRHPRLQDRARTTHLKSHSSSHSIRLATAGATPQVRGLAILEGAAGSLSQRLGPRSPAARSRARDHAPGTGIRYRHQPLPAPAKGARHNVPPVRTAQMHRQSGAPDDQGLQRYRASPQVRSLPPSTSEDSMRSDRRERVDPGQTSFATIARPRRWIRGQE